MFPEPKSKPFATILGIMGRALVVTFFVYAYLSLPDVEVTFGIYAVFILLLVCAYAVLFYFLLRVLTYMVQPMRKRYYRLVRAATDRITVFSAYASIVLSPVVAGSLVGVIYGMPWTLAMLTTAKVILITVLSLSAFGLVAIVFSIPFAYMPVWYKSYVERQVSSRLKSELNAWAQQIFPLSFADYLAMPVPPKSVNVDLNQDPSGTMMGRLRTRRSRFDFLRYPLNAAVREVFREYMRVFGFGTELWILRDASADKVELVCHFVFLKVGKRFLKGPRLCTISYWIDPDDTAAVSITYSPWMGKLRSIQKIQQELPKRIVRIAKENFDKVSTAAAPEDFIKFV